MKFGKRCFVRIISFLIAGILVVFGCFLKTKCEKEQLKERIALGYKQSLSEFSEILNDINFSLKKQLYAASEQTLSALSEKIKRDTAAAKECLSRLPISQEKSENIYKFLTSAGDFSGAVANLKTDEEDVKNKEQLKKLISFSEEFSNKISQTAMILEENDSFVDDVDNVLSGFLDDTFFSVQTEDIEEIAASVPTLIYDGPFSENVLNKEAAALIGKAFLSKEEALKKAIFYTGESDLKYTCDENSNTESYIFEDDDTVCAVTKRGGFCLYMNENETPDKKVISDEEAVKRAKNYLYKITGLDFKESYHITDSNIITINFAYFNKGIVYYSDLIKVGVDLEDGDILSVEARGFIMNHHERENYKFKNSLQKAKEVVSSELTVISANKAMVTDDSKREIYCYEFVCKSSSGDDVLVYIDEEKLIEQDVFIIIHVKGGNLVI